MLVVMLFVMFVVVFPVMLSVVVGTPWSTLGMLGLARARLIFWI
jgi:hypothetical protein